MLHASPAVKDRRYITTKGKERLAQHDAAWQPGARLDAFGVWLDCLPPCPRSLAHGDLVRAVLAGVASKRFCLGHPGQIS